MLAHLFPPEQGTGTFRPAGLARGLTEIGWDVTVLSARPARLNPRNDALMRGLDRVRVVRTGRWEPAPIILGIARCHAAAARWIESRVFWPDARVGWLPFALAEAGRLHGERRFDILWGTSPPFSAALLGWMLRRRLRIPWVMDLRNEWTTNQYGTVEGEAWHRGISRRMERVFVEEASAVVTLSPGHSDLLRADHPMATSKVVTLENGHDGWVTRRRADRDRFRVFYAGGFAEAQEIAAVLDALARLTAKGAIPPTAIEAVWMGRAPESLARRAPATVACRWEPVRPAGEARQAAADADLLVLPVREGATRQLPGKLYEWLPMETPILVVGEAAGLTAARVIRAGRGRAVSARDAAALDEAIRSAWEAWREGRRWAEPDRAYIERFRRDVQSAWLASLFTAILAGGQLPSDPPA